MELSFYPSTHSEIRPFFVEIRKTGDKKTFQLFRAQYLYPEMIYDALIDSGEIDFLTQNEVHPFNLGLEGELLDEIFPDSVTFFREDFIKFMIDGLNDRFELEFSVVKNKE